MHNLTLIISLPGKGSKLWVAFISSQTYAVKYVFLSVSWKNNLFGSFYEEKLRKYYFVRSCPYKIIKNWNM